VQATLKFWFCFVLLASRRGAMADAAVVVEEAVEVMCKLKQGEDYLGNIVLESGNEGLRCRFAWTARVEEVAASFDAHCKGVTCRGDPEVSSCLDFATPNLHASLVVVGTACLRFHTRSPP
jgi:hypothetical protein